MIQKVLQTISRLKWWIVAFFIVFFVLLLNSRPYYILMGLDNVSPFFGLDILWYRIKSDATVITNGPLLFTPTVLLGYALQMPAWIISHFHYFGSFMFGLAGYLLLVRKFGRKYKVGLPKWYPVLAVLFISGHLITLWLFSLVQFFYIAAFAGIPWVILYLTQKEVFAVRPQYALYIVGILFFFVSSMNLVAFLLFTIQVLIVAWFLKDENTNALLIGKKTAGILAFWFFSLQIMLLAAGKNEFLLLNIWQHLSKITIHPFTSTITNDLRLAENIMSNFLNTLRFATGWILMVDATNTKVFTFAEMYKSNPFIIGAGYIPLLFAFIIFFKPFHGLGQKLSFKPYEKYLLMGTFITSIVMTSYFATITQFIPVLREVLRFPSIKMWPLLLVFSLFLVFAAYYEFQKTETNRKNTALVLILLFIGILANGFPLFTGQIFSRHVAVQIPAEYEKIKTSYSQQFFVYPRPQKLYFREYPWGYYGSDFMGYYTTKHVIDLTSVSDDYNKYYEFQNSLLKCENTALFNNVTIIIEKWGTVEDFTANNPDIVACIQNKFVKTETNQYFDFYELK
jgi:hypothetical protein